MESTTASMAYSPLLSGAFLLMALLLIVLSFFTHLRHKRIGQRLLVDKINRVLPQTQCGQCGFEGCRPYARAIAQGEAINKCPPGGSSVIIKLASLVNDKITPLNPAHGKLEELKVAVIREDECIGCMKCIRACPVDAIIGSTKLMHTVIASECTGCDLCVEPCPVDCIDMIPAPQKQDQPFDLPMKISNPRQFIESHR